MTASPVVDEGERVADSLRLIEGVALAVEQHIEGASDRELSVAWELAETVRNSPEVNEFVESLRAADQDASIDTNSPIVIGYLNALAPVFTELQERHEQGTLVDPIDIAYGRFVEAGLLGEDATLVSVEKKKRPHCCTFVVPTFVPQTGCLQVHDNDFNSFFECLGELGSNFTISRGACGSSCSFIDYE